MVKYHMDRMGEAFERAKVVAAEISVRACKIDVHRSTDDELNQINIYAQFAAELRELIGRYEADLADFKTTACVARRAIDRVVNELINGMRCKATMRPFRGGEGGKV